MGVEIGAREEKCTMPPGEKLSREERLSVFRKIYTEFEEDLEEYLWPLSCLVLPEDHGKCTNPKINRAIRALLKGVPPEKMSVEVLKKLLGEERLEGHRTLIKYAGRFNLQKITNP